MFYFQDSPYPIIDETWYSGKVDIVLDANLTNIDDVNSALKKYDLQLAKSEREISVLVIRDATLN